MSDYTFSSIAAVNINPHKLRNIILSILAVVLIICALSSYSASRGLRIVHDPGSEEVFPFSANTVPPFSSVSFFSQDKKVLLKGWFFNVPDSSKAVVFAHDFSGNRLVFGSETDKAINICLDKGYSVLLFDQRNSGNVEASRTTLGLNEKNDLAGAVSYTVALGMRDIYIVAFGAGGNAALFSGNGPEVKGLVLDSPYYSFDSALRFVYGNRKLRGVFLTKTFTKLFLAISDRARHQTFSDIDSSALPPVMITASGFSYLDTREGRKVYDSLLADGAATAVLASLSAEKDVAGYLDMVFTFFNEYAKPQEETE